MVLHDVTKRYPNGKEALKDVELVVPEGDFVFLVGPSGAGKSTLMKLLIRDELATQGMVVVDGDDLARLRRRQVPKVRRKIGIVFQDFKLLPRKTVWENVAFALEVTGTPRRQIRPAVDRVLSLVGLTAQAQQLPTQLSGGEQQRTAIARALVHDPRIIIADEPTGNLDPVISWEIIQLLLRINELGVTILMATHDAEVVTALRQAGRRARGRAGSSATRPAPPTTARTERRDPVRRFLAAAGVAGVLAQRADEPRGDADDGPDAPAPGRLLRSRTCCSRACPSSSRRSRSSPTSRTTPPTTRSTRSRRRIGAMPEVASVEYVSRDEALERFRADPARRRAARTSRKYLESNPLYASVDVKLHSPSDLDTVTNALARGPAGPQRARTSTPSSIGCSRSPTSCARPAW